MEDINKMILFNKSKKEAKLDVLNLIIETNPKKLNLDKISNKIKKINPIFTDGTLLALQSQNLVEIQKKHIINIIFYMVQKVII